MAGVLEELTPLEEVNGYPVMSHVRERLQTGDWTSFARLNQRITGFEQ